MTGKVSQFGSLTDRLPAQNPPAQPQTPAPALTHLRAGHVLVQMPSGDWVPGLMAGWWRTQGDRHWIARVAHVDTDGDFVVRDVTAFLIRPLPPEGGEPSR